MPSRPKSRIRSRKPKRSRSRSRTPRRSPRRSSRFPRKSLWRSRCPYGVKKNGGCKKKPGRKSISRRPRSFSVSRKAYKYYKPSIGRKVSVKRSRIEYNRPKSKSKVRIGPLRQGTLRQFGYSTSSSERSRHIALAKAVKSEGYLPIYRKLNAVYVLQRNTSPSKSKLFKRDRDWLKKKFY